MSNVVLDASAIMALLNQEPGGDQLTPDLILRAACSTVNVAEVQGRLVNGGVPPDQAWLAVQNSVGEAIPFTSAHAKKAGDLITQTRPFGLSLGDLACLALALDLKAPVYTADRSWKDLKIGVRIHLIR